jgi:hypothetical protein
MGIRAIVANSGNANALTGPRGAVDERAVAAAAAAALGVEPEDVLTRWNHPAPFDELRRAHRRRMHAARRPTRSGPADVLDARREDRCRSRAGLPQ